MQRLFTLAVLALVAASFATSAHAQDKKKKDPDQQFAKMDANNDKKLSLDEFKGKRQGDKADAAEKAFKRLDKDNDGSVSLEEFKNRGKKKAK